MGYIGKDIVTICPRCGDISSELPEEHYPCVFCKYPEEIHTEFPFALYVNDISPSGKGNEWKQHLREEYVLTSENKEYDQVLYEQRAEVDYQKNLAYERAMAKGKNAIQANPYACPKCGGESFTPVRRNWSIWNGHRTNKIDMVCNKCGYVKKG